MYTAAPLFSGDKPEIILNEYIVVFHPIELASSDQGTVSVDADYMVWLCTHSGHTYGHGQKTDGNREL